VDEFCVGQPIIVNNLSEFGINYKWLYNGQEIFQNTPNLVYQEGEDNLTLVVLTGGCSDTIIKPLIARKNPNPNFDFKNVCIGIPYKIVNLSTDPENGPLDVNWHISTNYQSTNWNPEYTPANDDAFIIALEVTNQFGCSLGIQKIAKAFPTPIAKFRQSDNVLFENQAFIHFQDESTPDVNEWQWSIGDQLVYNGSDFYHEFTNTGIHHVSLFVKNEFGCSDSSINQIEVIPSLTVFVPNTFTPNGDEINQLFYPVFSGSYVDRKNYSFLIYNRWGEVVFQTSNVQDTWDGLCEGKPCMQGTYSWEIICIENSNKVVKRLYGHVNLVR
jgi:gliding motility-associated-like protein